MFRLLVSEREYVRDLRVLYTVYADPFLDMPRTPSFALALHQSLEDSASPQASQASSSSSSSSTLRERRVEKNGGTTTLDSMGPGSLFHTHDGGASSGNNGNGSDKGGGRGMGRSGSLDGGRPKRKAIEIPAPLRLVLDEVPELIKVNGALIQNMEATYRDGGLPTSFADVFSHFAGVLKHYAGYLNNHPAAVEAFQDEHESNPMFAAFFDRLANSSAALNLPLLSYLIKPVRRICSYPAALGDLVSATPPEHPDYGPLVATLGRLKAALAALNESRRTMENRLVVHELANSVDGFSKLKTAASSRLFITMIEVEKYVKDLKRSHPRTLVLLSDVLLLVKPKNKKESKLALKRSIPLEQIVLSRPRESALKRNLLKIQHVGGKTMYVSFATRKELDYFESKASTQITWCAERLRQTSHVRHLLSRRSTNEAKRVADLLLFADGLEDMGLMSGYSQLVLDARVSVVNVYENVEYEAFCYLLTDAMFWTVENPLLGRKKRAKPQTLHTLLPLLEIFVAEQRLPDVPPTPKPAKMGSVLTLAIGETRGRGMSHLDTNTSSNAITLVHTGVAKYMLYFDSAKAMVRWSKTLASLVSTARNQGPATLVRPTTSGAGAGASSGGAGGASGAGAGGAGAGGAGVETVAAAAVAAATPPPTSARVATAPRPPALMPRKNTLPKK